MVELVLEGSPFERGCKHGRHFSDRIRAMVHSLWNESRGEAVLTVINATSAHLENLFPEINEEIRGIAEGSGVTFEQAFLFNNRGILNAVPTEGCSHVAVIRDGQVIAGMNKDAPNQKPSDYFVARVRPSQGHARVGYCHVGRVWGYGINDGGLCAAGTSAHPARESHTIPSIGLYLVGPIVSSRCGTVAEAVDLMMGLGSVSESGNVLVADENGAAVVEFSPDKRVVRRPERGVIASTNFYASGEIDHSSDQAFLDETRARYANIRRLAEAEDAATLDGMKRILSYHAEKGAVCRHNTPGDRTVFSYIAVPRERRFLITAGRPCEHEYAAYALP